MDGSSDQHMGLESEAEPDRIVSTRVRNDETEYRIRWKGHGAHEDSWAKLEKMQSKYPSLLEEWQKNKTPLKQKKRKISDGDEKKESLPAPPSKKRSLPKTVTKEKITKICGVKYDNQNKYKWIVELKDGSHADLQGEQIIKLHPDMFLSYVESKIKNTKNKSD